MKILVASDDYVKALDPSRVIVASQYQVLDNLTRRLVRFGRGASLELDLAKNIDHDPLLGLLRVELREAYFSDGRPITARHVVNSFRRIVRLGSPHTAPDKIFDLSSGDPFRIDGPKHLSIRMKAVPRSLYYFLQLVDYGILTDEQVAKESLVLSDWTVSSGPYFYENANVFKKNKYLDDFKRAPISFELYSVTEEKVKAMFRAEYDICKVPFGYFKNLAFWEARHSSVQIVSNGFSNINYLNLNVNSAQFRNEATRRWIRSRILGRLDIPETRWMGKAYQYFLPGTIADTSESKARIIKLSQLIEGEPIPKELVEGVVIRTTKNMNKYHPERLEALLKEALGIPVRIEYVDTPQEMVSALESGNFSAYMVANSMSYHEVSETLNLLYVGNTREHKDPTGIVRRMIAELSSSSSELEDVKIYNRINLQMFYDSENIPLFFVSSPIVHSTQRYSIGDSDFLESLQIWRLEGK